MRGLWPWACFSKGAWLGASNTGSLIRAWLWRTRELQRQAAFLHPTPPATTPSRVEPDPEAERGEWAATLPPTLLGCGVYISSSSSILGAERGCGVCELPLHPILLRACSTHTPWVAWAYAAPLYPTFVPLCNPKQCFTPDFKSASSSRHWWDPGWLGYPTHANNSRKSLYKSLHGLRLWSLQSNDLLWTEELQFLHRLTQTTRAAPFI